MSSFVQNPSIFQNYLFANWNQKNKQFHHPSLSQKQSFFSSNTIYEQMTSSKALTSIKKQINNIFVLFFGMSQSSPAEKHFHNRNITIRKAIREIDFNLNQQHFNNHQKAPPKSNINVLVVGPQNSGKSSLLKTIAYAYNGYSCPITTNKSIGNQSYNTIEIKKSKRSAVEGLSKLKEADEKIGIRGLECVSYNPKSILDKYSKAMELLCCSPFGCVKEAMLNKHGIMICVICLSMVEKIDVEELNSLRMFIGSLQEQKIKYLFVGTKVDNIISSTADSQEIIEKQKLLYIDNWRTYMIKQLNIRNHEDIMCIENYHAKEQIQNSEPINFYALKLLYECVKKSQQFEEERKRVHKKGFWLCS